MYDSIEEYKRKTKNLIKNMDIREKYSDKSKEKIYLYDKNKVMKELKKIYFAKGV